MVTLSTASAVLLGRAEDSGAALLFEDQSWSYRELVVEARRRARIFADRRDPTQAPHIGVLLENVPEYLFWLAGAAISGAVVVGINSTYRGAQLEQLVSYTDCQTLVTSSAMLRLLDGLDLGRAKGNILDVDSPEYRALLDTEPATGLPSAAEDDLFLLIFTSGSTGLPKAVRCTQGRFARTGEHVAGVIPLGPGDVVYTSLPFFHSSSLFTGWSSAITAGVPIATRRRFSASQTLGDLRRHKATVITYTGKVLNYILSVPEQDDDADNMLKLAIGNEASPRDIGEFARRFGCRVSDAYGSTEGIIIIRRDSAMPEGALGKPAGETGSVKILDSETGLECPPADLDESGRVTNLDEAVGEIVETKPSDSFEGYYKNEAATKTRFRLGLLLVGRPRLSRPRWLVLLRGPLERMASGGRRELRGRARRGNHQSSSSRAVSSHLRCTRRPGRGPGYGNCRGDSWALPRSRRAGYLPRRSAGPGAQVGSSLRSHRGRASKTGEHEDRQTEAPQGSLEP